MASTVFPEATGSAASRRELPGFYAALALAISASAFTGFFFTYFSPIFAGSYPPVSLTVHIHGWSFFLWYLLFPLQAALIAGRRVRLHMALGKTSVVLVAVMVVSSLVVLSMSMERALAGGQDDFSVFLRKNGGLVFVNLLLFVSFYAAALGAALNGRLAAHKRLIILASASGLGAALFRLSMVLFGQTEWAGQPLWAPVTALFVLAAMVHDRIALGGIHPIYWKGLAWIASLHLLFWPFAGNPVVTSTNTSFAALSGWAGLLYP